MIGNFKELLNLNKLQNLKIAAFSDPHFGENPICQLCNYQTYVLYHLPRLEELDTLKISQEAKQYAEATFMKKRMYYNMRIKTIQRTTSSIIKCLLTTRQFKIEEMQKSLTILLNNLKSTEKNESQHELVKKTWMERRDELRYIEQAFKRLRQSCFNLSESNISRFMIELETGGNIRFEEGKVTDKWYVSCVDLLNLRFSPDVLVQFGIYGIKVNRVTRIHNRFLRQRFEDFIECNVDTTDQSYKKYLEYLFYGTDPSLPQELHRVMEEGFRTPQEYAALGLSEAIILANSVSMADLARIKDSKSMNSFSMKVSEIMAGKILICRVFLQSCFLDNAQNTYEGNETLQQLLIKHPIKLSDYTNAQAIYRMKTDDNKQKVCFIFDNFIVLPEYYVEFEYNFIHISRIEKNLLSSENAQTLDLDKEIQTFSQISSGEPLSTSEMDRAEMSCLKPGILQFLKICCSRSKEIQDVAMIEQLNHYDNKVILTEQYLSSFIGKHDPLTKIIQLNLHKCGIERIQSLDTLINLEILILSFNEIQQIEGLQVNVKLQNLDLTHNKIQVIENLSNNANIQYLILYSNEIQQFDCLRHLQEHLLKLKTLCLLGNSISLNPKYRIKVIRELPNLISLDEENISKEEKENSLQNYTEMTQELIRSYSSSYSCNLDNLQSGWEQYVECITLNHMNLQIIKNLNSLQSLKILSLVDNEIEKIKGLQNLINLEELNLEGNFISKIENLQAQTKLRKLDLGKNRISKIQNLNHMEQLTQLSLEDNRISCLQGLQNLKQLMELYIGNNRLDELKQVNQLKQLPKLIILDLSGNQLAKEKNYRLYLVFNLRRLKVLDGLPIDQVEISKAKELYNGRITEELLENKLGGKNSSEVIKLDLSGCKLKDFDDMITPQMFPFLKELNLSDNFMQTLRGIGTLDQLQKLILVKNKIETLYIKQEGNELRGLNGLKQLETLDVTNNYLKDFYGIQFAKLSELQVFRAAKNEIQRIDFMDQLQNLRELDLKQNKIRFIEPTTFFHNQQLKIINLEENGIKNLSNFDKVTRLRQLYLANNRIHEFQELDRLSELKYLIDLTLTANPICRKPNYRIGTIKRLTQIMKLDHQQIAPEEKEKAEQQAFIETLKPPMPAQPVQNQFIKQKNQIPVKLTSVNFEGIFKQQGDSPNSTQQIQQNNQSLRRPSSQQGKGQQQISFSPLSQLNNQQQQQNTQQSNSNNNSSNKGKRTASPRGSSYRK